MKMDVRWTMLLVFVGAVTAQQSGDDRGQCDYYQRLEAGDTFYIYNPSYPNNYTGAMQCRWVAQCPPGFNCRLDCSEIWLPESTSCMLDRLMVSRSGDLQMSGANRYCGRGSLSLVSTGQRISIGVVTNRNTPGGRFSCQVTAQPAQPDNDCRCGVRRQNRIVGGEETGINEFPMMVGLVDMRTRTIKCGAAIISQQYVLTAAHCLDNKRVNDTVVVVGEHDVTTGNDTSVTKAYRVASYIIHPAYNPNSFDNDIALIKVYGNISFNDRVSPVCLPFKYRTNSFSGSKVTILGWGTLEPGAPDSDVLMKVDVDVISQTQCAYKVSTLTDRQMCTYTPGKDSCQDDSGGPLLYTDPRNALLYLVGIVSYGLNTCANYDSPAINTRVTSHLDWIVASTRANFCYK